MRTQGMSWISVCQQGDVSEDEPKAVEVEGKKIGVFFVDENYFAIENVCPHGLMLVGCCQMTIHVA